MAPIKLHSSETVTLDFLKTPLPLACGKMRMLQRVKCGVVDVKKNGRQTTS